MTSAESLPHGSPEQLDPEAIEFTGLINDRFDANGFEATTDNPYEVELGVTLDGPALPDCPGATHATLIRDYPGGDPTDQGQLTGPRVRVFDEEDRSSYTTIFHVHDGSIWEKRFANTTSGHDSRGRRTRGVPRSRSDLQAMFRDSSRQLSAPLYRQDGTPVSAEDSQAFRIFGEPLSAEKSRQVIEALRGAHVAAA